MVFSWFFMKLDFKELDFKELGVLGYLLGVLGYLLAVSFRVDPKRILPLLFRFVSGQSVSKPFRVVSYRAWRYLLVAVSICFQS